MNDNITKMLKRLAIVKDALGQVEAQATPLNNEMDALRLAIMNEMQATKSKRTEAIDGYYVVRAERTSLKVADPILVEGWLETQGFDLAEYYKLDETRVKAAAESALKENGELVPGTVVNTTEYLSIKEAK